MSIHSQKRCCMVIFSLTFKHLIFYISLKLERDMSSYKREILINVITGESLFITYWSARGQTRWSNVARTRAGNSHNKYALIITFIKFLVYNLTYCLEMSIICRCLKVQLKFIIWHCFCNLIGILVFIPQFHMKT